jgi:hypothetical protein
LVASALLPSVKSEIHRRAVTLASVADLERLQVKEPRAQPIVFRKECALG